MGIPASQRLRKQSEFLEVRSSEHRIHCGPFVVQCLLPAEPTTEPPKLGVIASRRVGNAAKRNRGKRLIRELFRLHADLLPPASHVVIVLRSGYDRLSFTELESHFIKVCTTLSKRATGGASAE